MNGLSDSGLIAKQNNLRKLFRLMGVDFADLANEIYLGNFNDSVLPKFNAFLDIFGGVENPRLTLYLMDSCDLDLRDERTPSDYGREVMRGWLVEDCLASALRSRGLDVTMCGSDKNREFFTVNKGMTPNTPDLIVNNRYIEVVTDWTGWWKRKDRVDLRLNKVDMLYGYGAILIGVCPKNETLLMIDTKITPRESWVSGSIDGYNKSGNTLHGVRLNIGTIDSQIDLLERKLQ